MRCLIKNIPPLTFGIAGNRGVGFPLTDRMSVLLQPSQENCFLVKEDGVTSIYLDSGININVACIDPTDICIIVTQEDREVFLAQQEGDELFCSDASLNIPDTSCYLAMQEDSEDYIPILEQDGDQFTIHCEQEAPCNIIIIEDGVTYDLADEYRDKLFVECEEDTTCNLEILVNGVSVSLVDETWGDDIFVKCETEGLCYVALQENGCSPLADEIWGDKLYLPCDTTEHCFLSLQEDECIAITDGVLGDSLYLQCETGRCDLALEEDNHISIVDQENREPLYSLGDCIPEVAERCDFDLMVNGLVVPFLDTPVVGEQLSLQCVEDSSESKHARLTIMINGTEHDLLDQQKDNVYTEPDPLLAGGLVPDTEECSEVGIGIPGAIISLDSIDYHYTGVFRNGTVLFADELFTVKAANLDVLQEITGDNINDRITTDSKGRVTIIPGMSITLDEIEYYYIGIFDDGVVLYEDGTFVNTANNLNVPYDVDGDGVNDVITTDEAGVVTIHSIKLIRTDGIINEFDTNRDGTADTAARVEDLCLCPINLTVDNVVTPFTAISFSDGTLQEEIVIPCADTAERRRLTMMVDGLSFVNVFDEEFGDDIYVDPSVPETIARTAASIVVDGESNSLVLDVYTEDELSVQTSDAVNDSTEQQKLTITIDGDSYDLIDESPTQDNLFAEHTPIVIIDEYCDDSNNN